MHKSIILVENDKRVSDGIKCVLEDTFESEVVAEITTNEDITVYYQLNQPDFTLISMDPSNESEVSYAKSFINNNPDAVTIALSSSKDQVYHKFVREIGFVGFINKNNFLHDFKSTLNAITY